MSYTPTEWKDHIVEYPNRFRVVDNGDGTVNILDEHGNVIQQGTPVNAANLNKMEQGIKDAHDAIDAHLNDFAQVWSNRIVEMGTNANGTYVRWSNGLQVCWFEFRQVSSLTLSPGQRTAISFTFPASFSDNNYVVCLDFEVTDNDGNPFPITKLAGKKTTTGFDGYLWNVHPTATTSQLRVRSFLAVGRWN